MATITGISNITLEKAEVALSASPDSAAVDKWTLVPVTAGASSSCVYHAKLVGAACTVYFSPPLSPTATYTLGVTTTTGSTDTASSQNFAAPNTNRTLGAEWNHGVLRAWSRAVTQVIQEYAGIPATLSTQDLQNTETTLFVESTLGFPTEGYFYLGSDHYRYQGRGDACLTTITRDEDTVYTEPRRQVVYLDISEVWPPEGRRFLTSKGRAYNDPNGVL